jgi:hypothetical protein
VLSYAGMAVRYRRGRSPFRGLRHSLGETVTRGVAPGLEFGHPWGLVTCIARMPFPARAAGSMRSRPSPRRSPASSAHGDNPQGCQRVAGGRQTSGTVGKEHSTRNGSQTDIGGRVRAEVPEPSWAWRFAPWGQSFPLACLRHAIAFITVPEVERPPPLTLRRRAPPPATFWQPSGLLVHLGLRERAKLQAGGNAPGRGPMQSDKPWKGVTPSAGT